ncbi:hypothetical protein DPMN_183648 [Dreissena polymorpha]|uniref:Uncharacterized protein n=1 Tax=Dreissena polymorpha TaxID=45954 RepID=A0A9D4I766_DREPO|nr:hypothetical protein DPMN_183648 [Dreissena polymorpha]
MNVSSYCASLSTPRGYIPSVAELHSISVLVLDDQLENPAARERITRYLVVGTRPRVVRDSLADWEPIADHLPFFQVAAGPATNSAKMKVQQSAETRAVFMKHNAPYFAALKTHGSYFRKIDL